MELIEQSLKVLGNRSLQQILINAPERLTQDPINLSLSEIQAAWEKCLIKLLEWTVHRPHLGLSNTRNGAIPNNIS